jgi:hypothetical protein
VFIKDNFNIASKLVTKQSDEDAPITIEEDYSSLAGLVKSRFDLARLAKQQRQEKILLDAYRAWRGELAPDEAAAVNAARVRMGAASSVFIKVTKTKTTAAYGQLCEILFANNKYPLGVEPTPRPEGIDKVATIVPEGVEYDGKVQDKYGFAGDGREIEPGATSKTLLSNLKSSLGSLIGNKKVVPGNSPDAMQLPEIYPAQIAATNLEQVMQDQLIQGKAEKILRRVAMECTLYGTGIQKGPFTYVETKPNWTLEEDGAITYNPEQTKVPKFSHVSVWDYYPDPDARSQDECDYECERHLMSRSQVAQLKGQPKFDNDAINALLEEAPTYSSENWELAINNAVNTVSNKKYEVIEYWGSADKDLVQAFGLDLDEEDIGVVQVNAWVCQGHVIRLTLNPFIPTKSPYHLVTYEEHPHSIWGIGVPENMSDSQKLINGHMRMAIDNLRFAGSQVFEVAENQLVPGQDFSIYPGKVFRKQGGAPGQAVFSISFPNVSQSHYQMIDKARAFADESTGLPSYMSGQTGSQSGIRSASQTSMLMSAAALNIKTVAKNFDEFLTSIGESLFNWNMQFNSKDKDIRGDIRIVAKGTASLMQREVITQRLLSLLQIGANPLVAPFLKANEVMGEIVRNMDLDKDRFINNPAEAKMFAEIMQVSGAGAAPQVQGQAQPAQGEQGLPQEPSTGDNTGNVPAPANPGVM